MQIFTEAFVIWERTKQPAPHRKCKYTVSLLMRLFSVPLLARSVASDTLRDFVSAMLLTLIDGRVLEIQEGGNLMKVPFSLVIVCHEQRILTSKIYAARLGVGDAADAHWRPGAGKPGGRQPHACALFVFVFFIPS